jgi:uncharacterized protein with GYD domain
VGKEGQKVATYVHLINWTEQGVSNFRDTGKRADAFKELVQKQGGTLKSIFWTLGSYDIVAVVEAPDDETITALALQVSALGNIRTTTLRAFDRGEFEAIIKKAG